MFSAASSAIRGALKLPAAAPDPFADLDDVDRAATDPGEAVCLEALIDSARAEILTYHFATRPANTTKNYAPKQKEWSAWCKKYAWPEGGKYLPGDWVDEGKLLLFIREEVASRPPRRGRRLVAERKRRAEDRAQGHGKRRKKRGNAWESVREDEEDVENDESNCDGRDDEEGRSDLFLMYNTVRGYVSAVNELWKVQTSQGLHKAPMPVNVALNALKTSVVRREHHRRREEFVDRGEATIQDGYTVSQIPQLHDKVWSLAIGGERAIEQALRTKVDFLFGNSMLLRSSNRLPMELPDLFSVDLPREGLNGSGWAFVTVMDQGKTNQHGRREYGAALRHRDHKSCLIGALAEYFFWRWHLSGEVFPSFRTNRDWYERKVLKRDNAHVNAKLSDSTASQWTKKVFAAVGIRGSKVGHSGRVKGAQIAEARGVSESEIRRGGRWNADQMTGCYLTTLPRAFMRGIADFSPDYESSYHCPREDVKPPDSLRRRVWPPLDRWKNAHLGKGSDVDIDQDIAAGGFLSLLDRLRDVFLQVSVPRMHTSTALKLIYLRDAALIQREHPQHPIFQDALFSSPEWAPFAASVVAAEFDSSVGHEPWALLIQKAMPAIEESLRNVVGRQDAALSKVLRETSDIKAMLEKVIKAQEEQARQEFTVTTTTTVSPTNASSVVVVSKTPPPSPGTTALASTPVLHPRAQFSLGGAHIAPPTPITALIQRDLAPTYKLNRDIHTIPQLWKLWTVGMGGAPSVEELDRKYGSSWRNTASERQYYSMRKTLIDEIRRRAEMAGDMDFTRVVRDMEASRMSSHPPASINKIIKTLKEGNKAKKAQSIL